VVGRQKADIADTELQHHQPSNITTIQLVLWAADDNVKHCLSFTTWTLVSCCNAPLTVAWYYQAASQVVGT